MITDEQFAKLPQWAQREIRIMRADIKNLEARAEGRANGFLEDPDTFIDNHSGGRVPIGRGTTITFKMGDRMYDDGEPRQYIDVRVDKDGLYIQGIEAIAIFPGASNTAHVQLAQR